VNLDGDLRMVFGVGPLAMFKAFERQKPENYRVLDLGRRLVVKCGSSLLLTNDGS
jgi:hypothetical protein